MRSRLAKKAMKVQTDAPLTGQAFPRRSLLPRAELACGPATEILLDRLTPGDVGEVRARLRDEHRGIWETATPENRKRLTLALGLAYGVEGIQERTGLTPSEPPATVHSMTRGVIIEIGGSYYLADLVLESLQRVGDPLVSGSRALDYSCSSGRAVRALAAARPDVQWYGCDPNSAAIDWSRSHIPGVEFFVADLRPPLPFENHSLDLAFAISVWSHYSSTAALRWLEEMHRLIRPGGHLVLTTHGLNSCVWFSDFRDAAIEAQLGPSWIIETAARLQRDGHCFWNVFGDRGDWGVVDAEWGLAFFTPEWLLANSTPGWSVRDYGIGRALDNQDVYVLERR